MIQKSMAMALALGLSTGALALATNPGFWPEAVFDEANPPAGWDLRDQEARALVSRVDFAYSGQHVFRFEQLDSGFGANKLEQCVELIPGEDFDFGIMVRSPVPSEQMAVRLNVEFYANQGDCQSRSDRNAQIGNDDFDHALDLPANAWRAYGSGVYSADSLLDAGAPGFARISFRLRDRSGEEGQPAERRRQVYLDAPWANGAVALANPSFDLVDYPEDIRFEQDSGLLGWDLRDVAGGAWLSQVDFARSNGTVFWFDQLERGFGDNKLEQCVALPTGTTESSRLA